LNKHGIPILHFNAAPQNRRPDFQAGRGTFGNVQSRHKVPGKAQFRLQLLVDINAARQPVGGGNGRFAAKQPRFFPIRQAAPGTVGRFDDRVGERIHRQRGGGFIEAHAVAAPVEHNLRGRIEEYQPGPRLDAGSGQDIGGRIPVLVIQFPASEDYRLAAEIDNLDILVAKVHTTVVIPVRTREWQEFIDHYTGGGHIDRRRGARFGAGGG
jgi:hypothetical protein